MNSDRRNAGILSTVAVLALVMISFSGCSRNNAEAIAVTLVTVPSTVTVGQSVSLTAVIGSGSTEDGIDWSCSGGSCGTFTPAHTASGASTVYTAPGTPGSVTIVAAAGADSAAQASLAVSVVAADSNVLLHGTYVFSVQGENGTGSYAAAGTIVADGSGLITAGEMDYADESHRAGPDAVTGSYAIGPDGRGSLTLDANNTSLPQDGVETFSIAVVSASHALIVQFDGTAAASGSLDLQSASALDASAISGAYAFTTQGTDISNRLPIGRGGVLTLSALSGSVSGGTYFENDGGSTFSGATTGSVTAPDTFGRGTLELSVGVSFTYYAVQGRVLRLVESGLPSFMTAGSLFGQGDAGVNGTFSNASLAGSAVLTAAGASGFGGLALVGQFSADGAGNFTSGMADLNNGGVTTAGSIAGNALYTVSGSGVGTLDLPPAVDQRGSVAALRFFLVDPALNLFDPNGVSGGGGALVMDFDGGAVASGFILPQSAGVFDGSYALNFQFASSTGETDWVGRSAAAGGTFTGTADLNETGQIFAGLALGGAYAADTANAGRLTGTLTGHSVTHHITLYQVDASRSLFVDTDTAHTGIGLLEKE